MAYFRPLLWPTVFAVPAFAILIALGTWQVDRLAWKEDLIARAEARSTSQPVAMPAPADWGTLNLDDWEYRPVIVHGRFNFEREALVFTSLSEPKGEHGGSGYWVMTPLELSEGATVLINRGFVPEAMKSAESRSSDAVESEVRVVGLLRRSVQPNWFTPEADLELGVWFVRDIPAIASALGIGNAAPFFLDEMARPERPLPQAGETRLQFRNSHLGYAITWYGLAAALVVVYLAFHRAQGRLGKNG